MTKLEIVPGKSPLSLWRKVADGGVTIALAESAWSGIERSRGAIETALSSGRAISFSPIPRAWDRTCRMRLCGSCWR
jgi:histidine ammonia-lyase